MDKEVLEQYSSLKAEYLDLQDEIRKLEKQIRKMETSRCQVSDSVKGQYHDNRLSCSGLLPAEEAAGETQGKSV